MKRAWAIASLALTCTLGGHARARVQVEIDYVDAEGEGFFDEAPREPLDDNPGTTVGEQRRVAFERALRIWAVALESDVPIVVEATFAPFPELLCEGDAAVLGAAHAEAAFAGFRGAPRPDLFYPSPLADKLAGEDLDPGRPDIYALFNPRLDDADCLGEVGWDYHLGGGRAETSFVSSVLHELAHGLGFASLVDEVSGSAGDGLSIFESLMYDHVSGLTWDVMSDEQRRVSAASPFDLVWLGEHVTQAAPTVLAKGAPRVVLSNGEVLRWVAEPSFGPFLSAPLEGDLVVVAPREACRGTSELSGQVVLLRDDPSCPDLVTQLRRVADRGALAALTRSLVEGEPAFGIVADVARVPLVSLALSAGDFDALVAALDTGPLSVLLETDDALLGADEDGHVRLSAANPVQPGSSGSHWDSSVRRLQRSAREPNALLMEPVAGAFLDNQVSDLSVQLLQDLGWGDEVCGNHVTEAAEDCDEGIDNSDEAKDACRSNCRSAYCGDGVVDSGEACDPKASPATCGDDCKERRVEPEPEPRPEPLVSRDSGGLPVSEPARPRLDGGPRARVTDSGSGEAEGEGEDLAPESCACRHSGPRSPTPLAWLWVTAWALALRRRGLAARWLCARCAAPFHRTVRPPRS